MGQFTTTRLTGSRVLVEGTDSRGYVNKVVLDSSEWDALNEHAQLKQDQAAFDQAVEEFFEPLVSAADAVAARAHKPEDPASYVVLEEPVEGVQANRGVLVQLGHDSIVLRLIESGETDRLIWVGENLEILETPAPTQNPVAPEDTENKGFFSRG